MTNGKKCKSYHSDNLLATTNYVRNINNMTKKLCLEVDVIHKNKIKRIHSWACGEGRSIKLASNNKNRIILLLKIKLKFVEEIIYRTGHLIIQT